MAYNPESLVKLAALETMGRKVADNFPTKEAVNTALAAKADKATTLAGYGITDAYTKEEIKTEIGSVYRVGGSVAFADIPAADEAHLGMVYNVTDGFTTTDGFLEGAGKKHPVGTNVVIVASGGSYKYDVLSGFVDLSGFLKNEDLTIASNEEVQEALDTAFGTGTGQA